MDVATILTSTVVATVVSGLITGIYSLRAKQREYMNDYYKAILQKRIASYETLEALIVSLKTAVVDSDGRAYHFLFARSGDWDMAYNLLMNLSSQSLWLSEEAIRKTQELNYLVFRLNPSDHDVIQFGKENYTKIADLREQLERTLAADMLVLHDVKKFLQRRSTLNRGFQTIHLKK